MTLPPGSHLGPYVTIAAIGAGGMGVVYRAKDTRLDREVAVKLLAGDLHSNEELRERLAREARAVAKLSHPHICALYDVGREGERDYLVMELLTGRTLADRIREGPLPVEQILRIGMQIAGALAAAHAAGIVHRDLKPANVMLTPSGVKLLDFGIAKAFAGPGPAAPAEPSLTNTGLVLGTVPYMAPEQLEGRPADPRTDVFALGAVLYEMATARPAFSAPTQAALVATVLTTDPPSMASVRPGIPAALDRLVRNCLTKDPARRWQSSRDVELLLHSMSEEDRQAAHSNTADANGSGSGRARRGPASARMAWAVSAVALGLAAWSTFRLANGNVPASPEYQFTIPPPEGGSFAYWVESDFLSVSPDGSQLAFIARDSTGTQRVWLRSLSATTARPLAGTEGANFAFWAPDGRAMAFFTTTKLARLDLPDGAPVTLTTFATSTGQFGSWGRGGDLLYGALQGDAIYRIPAAGGTPTAVIAIDSAGGERGLGWPLYLPDGEHFLYVSRRVSGPDQLMLASPGEPPVRIMATESMVQYSEPGLIAWVHDGTLLGQAFDWRNGRLSGQPFAVADSIRCFISTAGAAFAASPNGVLVFQAGRNRQRLAWFDREGRDLGPAGASASYLTFAISPDGQRLLTDRENPVTGTYDVWLTDLARGSETPVTTARSTEAFGRWPPGQTSIVYSIAAGTAPHLVRRDLASGVETRLLEPGAFQQVEDVSPDGRTLLFSRRIAGATFDLWTMPFEGAGSPRPFIDSSFEESDATFSPDGRFVAFLSNETGRSELYVTPFPGPGEKTRVSREGARLARWARGSGELFYVSFDRRVVSVPVRTDPGLVIGTQTSLFTIGADTGWQYFDVTPDGRRFLASIPIVVADKRPITVITDWTRNQR